MKLLKNRMSLLCLLALLYMCTTTSCVSIKYFAPDGTESIMGATSYCMGAAASANTLTYDECHSGSATGSPHGVTCTAQWYYNVTGDTVAATSTPLGAPVSFTSSSTGTGTLTYTPLTAMPGTLYYFVRVTVPSGYCTTLYTSTTQAVTVSAAGPGPNTGPDHVCPGDTIVLTNTFGGGAWVSSDAAIATVSSSGTVSGIAAGTAMISYVAGCGSPAISTVTVNAPPAAISGSATGCAGAGTIALTDATPGGTWSITGTAATIDAGGNVTPMTPGVVTALYTIAAGCTTTHAITIDTLPHSITGFNHVCKGKMLTLTEATTGGTWSSSSMAVATVSATGIVTGVAAGPADITFATGCGITSMHIRVDTLPVPHISYEAATHTLSTTSDYVLYQWYTGTMPGTETLISGAIDYHLTDTIHHDYYYQVQVSDANGCAGKSAEYHVNTLAVSQAANSTMVNIYPNPATETLYITAPVRVRAVLTDMAGKTVMEQDNAIHITLAGLPAGTYSITLYDGNTILLTQKLVKQ